MELISLSSTKAQQQLKGYIAKSIVVLGERETEFFDCVASSCVCGRVIFWGM